MVHDEEASLWYYYPIIPYDTVLPGETVVLSISSVGFMGWEVDTDYAHIELFDEHSDEINTYISFIMPEDEAFVAALYTEIPYINFEYEKELYIAKNDMHEYGEAPTTASSSIPVAVGDTVDLEFAIQGEWFNVVFGDPTNLPAGRIVKWEMNVTTPNALPPGLNFDWFDPTDGGTDSTASGPRGGNIWGWPSTEGIYTFYATLTYIDVDGNTLGPAGRVGFILDVLPPTDDPVIVTKTVPDGMVGVEYDVTINTMAFNSAFTWAWELNSTDVLPPGLIIRQFPGDNTRGQIWGYPEQTAVTGTSFEFQIRASTAQSGVSVPPSEKYFIRIWERPMVELPEYFDGLVLHPYNPEVGVGTGNYADFINVLGASGLPGIASLPPASVSWGWGRLSGGLPTGLDLYPVGGDVTKLAISGIPAAGTEREYEIELSFRSTNRTLIIGETLPVKIPIKIWPRPYFDLAECKLPDGMVGPGNLANVPPATIVSETPPISWSIGAEPVETYRGGVIVAGGFPDGIESIHWYDPALPIGLSTDDNGGPSMTIDGNTLSTTVAELKKFDVEFELIHDNPNINGAKEKQEFSIMIWPRTYLTAIIEPRRDNSVGARVGRMGAFGDQLDDYQSYGRAIIPGEYGQIYANQTSTMFVRWELTGPALFASAADPTNYFRVNDPNWGIGENHFLSPPGGLDSYSQVWIYMPKPDIPESGPIVPINVQITGYHAQPPRVSALIEKGMLEVGYIGNFIIDNRNDIPSVVGAGPLRFVSWKELITSASEAWPPGLVLESDIGAVRGIPEEADLFTFHMSLTLPGTMKLTYGPFSILIEPFRPRLGDVDGSGTVDLADLLLLRRFVYSTSAAEREEIRTFMALRNSTRNGNIVSSFPDDPSMADLAELARWFAIQNSMPPTS